MDELFHSLERSQEQYFKNLKALHEAMHRARSPSVARSHGMERSGSSDIPPPSPVVMAVSIGDASPLPVPRATFASDLSLSPGDRRPRRLTNELADRKRLARLNIGDFDSVEWESDDDSSRLTPLPLLPLSENQGSSSTGESIGYQRVQKGLEFRRYEASHLVRHLQQLPDDNETTAAALGNVFARRHILNDGTVFTPGPDPLSPDNVSSTYEVYDIDRDGLAVTRHDDRGIDEEDSLDAAVVWGTIRVRICLLRNYQAQPADAAIGYKSPNEYSREDHVGVDDISQVE